MVSPKSIFSPVILPAFLLFFFSRSPLAAADCKPYFLRGDVYPDQQLNLSDAVATLWKLFVTGEDFPCDDAADSDDSGELDVTDVVYTLQFLFIGGQPPPDPGHLTCGFDPTNDSLDCLSSKNCDGMIQCDDNSCCPDGSYCARKEGDCQGVGICNEKPTGCTEIWDPVCGCDGLTYGNACEAAAAGVSILHKEACHPPEECLSNDDCPDGYYCAKAAGNCDEVGSCKERPVVCPKLWDPVCGCNKKTYANACEAAAAGVNILHGGPCIIIGDCTGNADCSKGEYCAKEEGDCDGMGTCEDLPVVCPDVWDPVCGCDGRTYGNACEAAAVGVNLLYRGPCTLTSRCSENERCPTGLYCARVQGDCDGEGVCQEIPEACPEVWDPVCGCDRQTYSNACFAAAAGVNVEYRGSCSGAGGCLDNGNCSPSQYCAKRSGDCDGPGTCQERPEACIALWDPVCGCDGRTYSNTCYAAAAGVNVLHEGPCVPPGCSDSGDCPANHYCARANGNCNGEGTCREIPAACPDVWNPVCGCDGVTYGNACEAAALGVNVLYGGICEEPEGCRENKECGAGEFCAKRPGDCDGLGTCQERPQACIALWDPVCGCDGRTYSNICYAATAGINVLHEGPCAPPECTDSGDCPAGNYCAKADGDCRGEGTCQERPQACPRLWDPVCGCDGNTYANACEAARAGVSIRNRGACMPDRCTGNANCPAGYYCAKAEGDCQGEGMCQERPEACIAIWDPVCGCDGNTYSNACYAASAGVNVEHRGPCVPPACRENTGCPAGQYCAKSQGNCNGEGTCLEKPVACPEIWDPVCGCDGKTYDNACFAAAAGINVSYRGVCRADPQ